MLIRPYHGTDLTSITSVFTHSIHALAVDAYSAEQRAAWAPQPPDLAEWKTRLAGLQTLVADEGDGLLGFISYEHDGHIDLLYTAPGAARRGIASALYDVVEHAISATDVTTLYTEASIVAAPFFASRGFAVVEEQRVMRRGIEFLRFAMTKTLAPA